VSFSRTTANVSASGSDWYSCMIQHHFLHRTYKVLSVVLSHSTCFVVKEKVKLVLRCYQQVNTT